MAIGAWAFDIKQLSYHIERNIYSGDLGYRRPLPERVWPEH